MFGKLLKQKSKPKVEETPEPLPTLPPRPKPSASSSSSSSPSSLPSPSSPSSPPSLPSTSSPSSKPSGSTVTSFGSLEKPIINLPQTLSLDSSLIPPPFDVDLHDFLIAAPECDHVASNKLASHVATQVYNGRFPRVHHVGEWGNGEWEIALGCSVVVVLVISAKGLQLIEDSQGAPNEFLRFIEVALGDFERNHRLILPLLCDDEDGKPFSHFSTSRFTQSKHAHPASSLSSAFSSVRETMAALFKLNGRPLPPTIVERTGDCMEKLKQAYQNKCHPNGQATVDRINLLRTAGSTSALHVLSYSYSYTRVNNDFTYFGKVCVTSLLTGEIDHTFVIPDGNGHAAAFSPDGRHVAAECKGGVAVYRMASGKFVWQQPEDSIGELEFLDDETLLVATTNGVVRCLSTEDGKELGRLTGGGPMDRTRGRPSCFLSVSRGSGLVAAGSTNKKVVIWRSGPKGLSAKPTPFYTYTSSNEVSRVALSPNGDFLAVATESGVQVVDLKQVVGNTGTNAPSATFPAVIVGGSDDDYYAGVLSFSPDGHRLFVSTQDTLRIFHVPSATEEVNFEKVNQEEERYTGYHSGGFLPSHAGVWVCSKKYAYSWSLRGPAVALTQVHNWVPSGFPPSTAVVYALPPDTPYLAPRATPASAPIASQSPTASTVLVAMEGTAENKYRGDKELRVLTWSHEPNAGLALKKTLTLPNFALWSWKAIAIHQISLLIVLYDDTALSVVKVQAWDLEGKGGHSQKPVYDRVLEHFESAYFDTEDALRVSFDGSVVYYKSNYGMGMIEARTGRTIKLVNMPGKGEEDDRWTQMVLSDDLTRALFVGNSLGFTHVAHVAAARRITFPDWEDGVRNAAFLPGQSLCLALRYDDSYEVAVCNYIEGTQLQKVSFWPKPARNGSPYLIPGQTEEAFALCDSQGDFAVYSAVGGNVNTLLPKAKSVYIDHRVLFQVQQDGLTAFVDKTEDHTLKLIVGKSSGVIVTSGDQYQSIDATVKGLQIALPPSAAATVAQRVAASREASNKLSGNLIASHFNMIALQETAAPKIQASAAVMGDAPSTPSGGEVAEAPQEDSGAGETWKCKGHRSLFHDVFISYRVWSDKDLSLKLALHLDRQTKEGGRGDSLRVFLDRHCLNDGEDWEKGFLYGLQYAAVAVLLISGKALQGIMQADQRQDNVLLEYEYALRGAQEGTKIVLPLFVNNDDFSPLVFPDLELFPEGKHNSPKTLFSSVRETMKLLRDSFSATSLSPTDRYTDCTATVLSHVRQAELEGVSRRLRAKALLDPSHTTTALFACSGGRLEVVGCNDGNLLGKPRSLQLGSGNLPRMACLTAATGKDIVYGATSNGVAAWSARDGRELWKAALKDEAEQIVLAPDGKYLAVVMGTTNELVLLRAHTGETRIRLGTTSPVASAAFTPDSRHVIAVVGRNLVVWELAGFGQVGTKTLRGVQAEHVAMAQTGSQVLVSGKEESNCMLLLTLDLQGGHLAKNPVYELDGSPSHVAHSILSPLGTYVASMNDDGDLMVHSSESCELLWSLPAVLFPKGRIVFSPDEHFVVGLQREPRAFTAFDVTDGHVLWSQAALKDATAFAFTRWAL